ncbi:SDR family NAD(P)-dependent oxidoreductase [Streptodolium elevatio]|uniref:SDR family NAD(P)-dependent oxidoreductase n=1 Tax=Streptodolium elevatio TaxID=3157996 RepID=A0ABV3DC14_9ACTN
MSASGSPSAATSASAAAPAPASAPTPEAASAATSHSARRTAVVIGVGPGLGMSVAHRFAREGYAVALVSRTATRHAAYLAALAGTGAEAAAYTADVRDRDKLLAVLDAVTERFGTIDTVYYGPASTDPEGFPKPITEADSASVRAAMSWMYPAVDVVAKVLPGMLERGEGCLLFATGLSAVTPMPALGNLAVLSAALHNYALTLNAALADKGVYAGSLVIGGLIERGDIHAMIASGPQDFGDVGNSTLDPDEIADVAWQLRTDRSSAAATFSAFG